MASDLESYIKGNEGCRLAAFDDATGEPVPAGGTCQGTLTIGYGHTGKDIIPGMVITQDQAEAFFQSDLTTAIRGASAALGAQYWLTIPAAWRAALVDMAFELGEYGLGGFHKMLAAMRWGDANGAAAELRASKYYAEVPARAERNRQMLLTNEFPA